MMKKSKFLALALIFAMMLTAIGGLSAAVGAETSSLLTADEMAANPDKMLPDYGYSGTDVVIRVDNGIIYPNSGSKFYYNDEVEGVDLSLKVLEGNNLGITLRATAQGAFWSGSMGYALFLNGTSYNIWRVDTPGDTTWDDSPVANGTLPGNPFDGRLHRIAYSAVENDENKAVISFSFDGVEVCTVTEEVEPLPLAGTEFKIDSVNGTLRYEIHTSQAPAEEPEEIAPVLLTGELMAANAENLLPDFDYTGDMQISVGEGKILSNDAKLYYRSEVEGVDINLQITSGTELGLTLRATAPGAIYSGSLGYALYLKGTEFNLWRVDTPGDTTWNDTLLANGTLPADLFDGEMHRLVYSAKENTAGRAVVKLSIDGTEVFSVTESEDALPIEGTEFKIDSVNDSSLRYQLLYTYEEERPEDYTVLTTDDLIDSEQLYDGAGEEAGKLLPLYDVVTSSGDGKIIYRNENVEAVSLDIRVTSGVSMFFVLRGTGNGAVWDGGFGYFFMMDKTETGTKIQLIKGVKAEANAEFQTLCTEETDIDFFDGERHTVDLVAYDQTSVKTRIKLTVDGTGIIDFTDTSGTLELLGTHFMILSGQSQSMYKIYGESGFDFQPEEGDYWQTITSKTLLKYSSDWQLGGAVMEEGLFSAKRDQTIVLFNRVLQNTMINFDIDIDDLGGNWVAILLNANKADALWNAGFRSNVVFLRRTEVGIEYWQPQSAIATVQMEIDMESRINVECGMYSIDADGQIFTFIRLAINGVEIYNQPLLSDSAWTEPGYFGLINYGCSYTFYATADEMDTFPSATDGTVENRQDESGMTTELTNELFAVIANSFNPFMDLENGDFNLRNNGAAAYGDSVNFSKLSFDLRFVNDSEVIGQYADFAFSKRRQQSFIGQTLADDYTNYGYAVRILPTGTVYLIKTDSGSNFRTLMTVDCFNDNGISFQDDLYHTFTIYRERVESGLKITLFIDDAATGYSVIDADYYEPNYPMDGFLSFANSANGCGIAVKNIFAEGTVTKVSETLEADAVNFVTYFGGEQPYVYFVFDSAGYTTRWVEVFGLDENGEYSRLLGRVYAQNRRFDLPADYTGDSVKVVSCAFTEGGNKEEILYLKDLEEELAKDPESVSRIAVQADENGAYFVYADTGERYLPVGGNYMGLRGGDHSTFDAATSFTEADYDPVKTEAMMRALAQNGGNVLRVFLIGRSSTNPGISGDPNIPVTNTEYYFEGLYIPYMENVTHFLRTAQKYGIYVMMALGDADVPSNSYYMSIMGGEALARNYMYMTEEGVNARKTYAENVVRYFKEKAPDCMSAIFSLEFQNEYAMYDDQWPFNLTSGNVTLANGKSYDMGDPDSREAAHRESTIYYLNTMTDAVKAVDPDLLVNEGSFTLNIVGKTDGINGLTGNQSGDPRYPATLDIYLSSKIDFVDIHIYFANSNNNTVLSSFADDLLCMKYYNEETQELLKQKPIFMGEFGPSTLVFKTEEEAEEVWTETVRLAKDANFQGFAVWTLESHNQKECWNILADDGKFDLFRELVRIIHGVEQISGVTAENVSGKAGEALSITVTGLAEGDQVFYRTDESAEWSETNPAFTEEGTYTVYYKVTRTYADDYFGSATVTVTAEDSDPGCQQGCGGSQVALLFSGAAVLCLIAAQKFLKH